MGVQSLLLKVSSDEAPPTTSEDKLFHWLIVLTVNLISSLIPLLLSGAAPQVLEDCSPVSPGLIETLKLLISNGDVVYCFWPPDAEFSPQLRKIRYRPCLVTPFFASLVVVINYILPLGFPPSNDSWQPGQTSTCRRLFRTLVCRAMGERSCVVALLSPPVWVCNRRLVWDYLISLRANGCRRKRREERRKKKEGRKKTGEKKGEEKGGEERTEGRGNREVKGEGRREGRKKMEEKRRGREGEGRGKREGRKEKKEGKRREKEQGKMRRKKKEEREKEEGKKRDGRREKGEEKEERRKKGERRRGKRRKKREGRRKGSAKGGLPTMQAKPGGFLGGGGLPALPKECAAVVLELKKRPRPRSPNFTTPVAVMNTLAGLMSGRGERKREREREVRERDFWIPSDLSLAIDLPHG
ncbi:Octapeptide-repeat protein T2, partial [Ophiophagus hannah]